MTIFVRHTVAVLPTGATTLHPMPGKWTQGARYVVYLR